MNRTRWSAVTLTVQQRRREIIDLLADHLARMPEALDIPPSRPGSPRGVERVSPFGRFVVDPEKATTVT